MAIFNSYVSLPEGICGDDCCFITILRDQKWPGPRISQEVWPHAQPEGRATGLVLGSALHFAEGNIAHTCIYTIYIYIHTYIQTCIHTCACVVYIYMHRTFYKICWSFKCICIYIYIHVYSFIDTSKRARDRHNLWTFALLCGCHIPRWRTEPPNLVYSWLSFKKGWSSDGRLDKLQLGLMEQSAAPVCWCQEMSRGW
jgi:hypothetical protein